MSLSTRPPRRPLGAQLPSAQRGVTLMIALIVLIAMTLSALGLMRSVFTSNRIAGNLSFQQAATQSADTGVETAVAWIESNNQGSLLFDHVNIGAGQPVAYFASRQDPAPDQTWEQFWPVLAATGRVNTLAVDLAGNQVSFVIQRMCADIGDPAAPAAGCSASPDEEDDGSKRVGANNIELPSQRYYRITSRVAGPRNTVSFVQVMVAI